MQRDFLLHRPRIDPEWETVAPHIRGKRVLVTGAGGSIGSELCRQMMEYGPEQLVLLGRGENSIFEIDVELQEKGRAACLIPVIVDIRDKSKLERVYREYRPQLVFHTAAHKHVHLMERHVDEAVCNNIFGTQNVAQMALQHGAEAFVLISSDKAINPTSVYGATKKASEYIVQSLVAKGETRFVVVRFGNVIRSRGSIIPLLERQICLGGPVTITHPKMTRFFMSIPEAAYLVLQSGAVAESGQVCVLDMGESVKIMDLANNLIEMAGLRPGIDIEIVFIGPRPGEKLVEEVAYSAGRLRSTQWNKILLDEPDRIDFDYFQQKLEELGVCAAMGESNRLVELLKEMVPTYAGGYVERC
jgi:FlaA1/EpsC-like NDP-sugar epimerase